MTIKNQNGGSPQKRENRSVSRFYLSSPAAIVRERPLRARRAIWIKNKGEALINPFACRYGRPAASEGGVGSKQEDRTTCGLVEPGLLPVTTCAMKMVDYRSRYRLSDDTTAGLGGGRFVVGERPGGLLRNRLKAPCKSVGVNGHFRPVPVFQIVNHLQRDSVGLAVGMGSGEIINQGPLSAP